jgi:hypothetical protein
MEGMKEIPPGTLENILPVNRNHIYFENSQDHPFKHEANEFEMVNAWWLAEAAWLAYHDSDFVKTRFESAGLPEVYSFCKGSTQCFVAHSDAFIIVTFRGTELHFIQESVTGLGIVLINLPDLKIDLNFILTTWGRGGNIHRGFKEGLEKVWNNLEEHLNQIKNKEGYERKLWFTGHSLGAALATLAADRYSRNHKVQGLYTFGSPYVGDHEFASRFNVANTYRFVNNNDMVTRIPPGYKHVGTFKYINNKGTIHDDPDQLYVLKDRVSGAILPLSEYLKPSTKLFDMAKLFDIKRWMIPIDGLTDHAPIYYARHVWNAYLREIQTIPARSL